MLTLTSTGKLPTRALWPSRRPFSLARLFLAVTHCLVVYLQRSAVTSISIVHCTSCVPCRIVKKIIFKLQMAPGPFAKLRNSFPFANRQKRDEVGDAIAAAASTGDVAGSGPTTTEATAPASSSSPAYHLNPERAKKYMKNITRFRILVIGRANAGKTTILQRVCNTVDDPEIFDGKGNKIDSALVQGSLKRGYHDIKDEFVFRSNPGFVFHDSCGFEAGSAEQFDNMKSFVVDCAVARSLRERIHAIWYCIPLTDYHRTVTAAELKFFNECDTGHVPVIVLLTKADVLNFTAMEELLDDGLEIDEAEEKAVEKERELLERWLAHVKGTLDKCKFPPKAIMSVKKMHEETADCTKLMQYTTNALNEEGLQMLLVSTQRSSIALCIEYAVQRALIPKMGLSTKDRLKLVTKDLEKELLSWFPNTKDLPPYEQPQYQQQEGETREQWYERRYQEEQEQEQQHEQEYQEQQ